MIKNNKKLTNIKFYYFFSPMASFVANIIAESLKLLT